MREIISMPKYGVAIAPAAILDDTAATAIAIDTWGGYKRLTIFFLVGATDVDVASMSVTECATSGGSYTTITGTAASGTTGDGRLPQDDDDNKVFMISVPITPSSLRYMKAAITAGNGTSGSYLCAMYVLSDGPINSSDATSAGLGGRIVI